MVDPLHDQVWHARHLYTRRLQHAAGIASTMSWLAPMGALIGGLIDPTAGAVALGVTGGVWASNGLLRIGCRLTRPVKIRLTRHQLFLGRHTVSLDRITQVDVDCTVHTPEGNYSLPWGWHADEDLVGTLRLLQQAEPAGPPPESLLSLRTDRHIR